MPEHTPGTLQVKSDDFYAGFRRASLDFELQYKPKAAIFDDIQITTIFVKVAYGTHTDLWKAGYQAGLFAALSGQPYSWLLGQAEYTLQYGVQALRRVS